MSMAVRHLRAAERALGRYSDQMTKAMWATVGEDQDPGDVSVFSDIAHVRDLALHRTEADTISELQALVERCERWEAQ